MFSKNFYEEEGVMFYSKWSAKKSIKTLEPGNYNITKTSAIKNSSFHGG